MKYFFYIFLSLLFCLFQNNQVMGEVDKDQKVISNKKGFYDKSGEQNSKYILGIQAGVTRVNIAETGYFKTDKIFDNYQPIVGIFLQKRLKKNIGLSGILSYKNFGFKAESSSTNYYSNLKIDNHYLSAQFDLHYFFSKKAKKISLFTGLELLYLIDSEEYYFVTISSHSFGVDLGFDSMKDILNQYSVSLVGGVSYKFNCVIPLRLFVQAEYSLLSPTRDRILKEGDYNPLPYPFKFINYSVKINIPIYNFR